jgi:hypothetical protein
MNQALYAHMNNKRKMKKKINALTQKKKKKEVGLISPIIDSSMYRFELI